MKLSEKLDTIFRKIKAFSKSYGRAGPGRIFAFADHFNTGTDSIPGPGNYFYFIFYVSQLLYIYSPLTGGASQVSLLQPGSLRSQFYIISSHMTHIEV